MVSFPVIIILSILFNIPIGWLAWKKDSLTIPDGIIAAGSLGMILFITHPVFWISLVCFFGSSTLLTKFKEGTETKTNAMEYAQKTGKRDFYQVMANGGIPLLSSVLAIFEEGIWSEDISSTWFVVMFIAFAVVNADTWATELGVTSNSRPYWILNPTKRVPRGSSGGVSLLGFVASALGALVIASVYLIATVIMDIVVSYHIFFLIILGGFIGSVADSFLGATVQAMYRCPMCYKITEKKIHTRCNGTITEYHRGIGWFNNDLVNFLSVIVANMIVIPLI